MGLNIIMDFVFASGKIFEKIRNLIHNNFKDQKKLITVNFSKNKRTLDFGSGASPFSVMFNPEYYYGADTDKKYIMFCKKNRKGNFFLIKNSPPYDFKNGFFDQILVSAVIHHIDDNNLIKIFMEFNRLMSLGGKLMIIDPFTMKNQKNLLCKLLIKMDRGNNFRDPEDTVLLASKFFKLNNRKYFINGPYKFYMLIFEKK